MLARILQISGPHTDSTIFRNSFGQFFNSGIVSTSSRYSPGFLNFSVLTLILPFSQNSSGQFFNSGTDSTFSLYSPGFYQFLVLTQILHFSDNRPYSFSIVARILIFPVLARILQISGTQTDSIFFRNSSGKFFKSGTESTFSRYSPRFYHFLVLTLILHFSETRQNSFSIVARILPFPRTRPDSTNFWYSH